MRTAARKSNACGSYSCLWRCSLESCNRTQTSNSTGGWIGPRRVGGCFVHAQKYDDASVCVQQWPFIILLPSCVPCSDTPAAKRVGRPGRCSPQLRKASVAAKGLYPATAPSSSMGGVWVGGTPEQRLRLLLSSASVAAALSRRKTPNSTGGWVGPWRVGDCCVHARDMSAQHGAGMNQHVK
eukprot:s112_g25.t1